MRSRALWLCCPRQKMGPVSAKAVPPTGCPRPTPSKQASKAKPRASDTATVTPIPAR